MGETVFRRVLVIVTLGLFAQLVATYLDVDLQKIEQLGEKKYIDCSALKIRKENKTRKIFGNVTLHIDLGNDVQRGVQMFKKSGSGYQLMPFKLAMTPFCDAINEGVYIYPEIAELSSFPPQPIPCPMPKGVYESYGFYPSGKTYPKMIVPSGDYVLELNLWKQDVEILRFRGDSTEIKCVD